MPLISISSFFSFLSAPPPVPSASPVTSNEQPTLRVCFPLRIQRGVNAWWEYEEYRVQFRDRLMWRQAFGLDADCLPCMSPYSGGGNGHMELNRSETVRAWREAVTNHDMELQSDDVAFKSRWSYSSSSSPSVRVSKRDPSGESIVSETLPSRPSRSRLRHLVTAGSSQPNESYDFTNEASLLDTSQPTSFLEQYQPLQPSPPSPALRQLQSPKDTTRHGAEIEEIRRCRDITLRMLEGRPLSKTKDRCLSALRNMFCTQRGPVLPVSPPPLPQSPPQGQGTICLPSEKWAKLRNIILSGLTRDAEGAFPPSTERQEAMFMPVEQKENYFKVHMRRWGEATSWDAVKAALEQMEARNWEDILLVTYEDTPREMRWWYTTSQPRVLHWGLNMI
ncbi:hypothetical protein TARUN_8603 [Trichoderma arundinaceum]|uniref:Uncharacterized protein n=1 Tax=Trichoderma arundinaceum TaxID=490622 RepID=A0A395NC08_TRIAR|nr:hypothetical protein TARUN_8603 [Trichoderma arundinaceum]